MAHDLHVPSASTRRLLSLAPRLEKWANKKTLFDHGEVPRRFNRFLPTKKIKGTELLLIDYHAGD